MLTVPSPPLVPQTIDAVATIPPRVRANLETSPVPHRRARPQGGGGSRAKIVPAILALQLAAVATALIGRAEVVRAMPESASLFRMIGLPVNLRGLVFARVETRIERRDGVTVLIVEGRIESESASVVAVPPLRFALRDAAGTELYAWTVPLGFATLEPGESRPFQTRMESPPSAGSDVLVRFARPADG